ncbi:MAG: hypothetical protein ABEH61_05435 [Haloarculaceae archaeon]
MQVASFEVNKLIRNASGHLVSTAVDVCEPLTTTGQGHSDGGQAGERTL